MGDGVLRNGVGTRVIGTLATEIFAWDMGASPNQRSIFFLNAGPGSLAAGNLQFSPDSTVWGTVDGTTIGALGLNVMKYGFYETSARFMRIQGAAVTGSVATCVWWLNL